MAENVNNKYYLKLEVITPLSVGAGNEEEWVRCADYVNYAGNVYILDLHKMAELGINLDQLSTLFVNQDHDGIIRLLGNRLQEVSQRVFPSPCATDNNIKAFERSQMHDLPVVAGSSLKGALRSVLFNYLRDAETSNEEVFGKMKDGSDYMRFVKVGDFEMPETRLFNSKIFNLHLVDGEWCGGWKHALQNGTSNYYNSTGFNTLYECIAPGVSGVGSVMLSLEQFLSVKQKGTFMSHSDKKQNILEGGLRSLFRVVNDFTRSYLLKERAFFEEYSAERSEQVVDCIDSLLDSIPTDNSSCLLKMSAGVGFHSITGDWQYDDYAETGVHESGRNMGKQKYKSRKIVETSDGLKLMGFVRLSEITVDAYRTARSLIEKTFSDDMKVILDKKQEAEIRRTREMQERQAKEENYNQLIEEAHAAVAQGNYKLAVSKAKEALALFPEQQMPQTIITQNEQNAKQQEAREAEETLKQVLNDQPPLEKDIASVVDFKMMKGRVNKRKEELRSPEGKALVEQWLEKYFGNLPQREKRNYQKPKRWIETFGDCYDEETITQWIALFLL